MENRRKIRISKHFDEIVEEKEELVQLLDTILNKVCYNYLYQFTCYIKQF